MFEGALQHFFEIFTLDVILHKSRSDGEVNEISKYFI